MHSMLEYFFIFPWFSQFENVIWTIFIWDFEPSKFAKIQNTDIFARLELSKIASNLTKIENADNLDYCKLAKVGTIAKFIAWTPVLFYRLPFNSGGLWSYCPMHKLRSSLVILPNFHFGWTKFAYLSHEISEDLVQNDREIWASNYQGFGWQNLILKTEPKRWLQIGKVMTASMAKFESQTARNNGEFEPQYWWRIWPKKMASNWQG